MQPQGRKHARLPDQRVLLSPHIGAKAMAYFQEKVPAAMSANYRLCSAVSKQGESDRSLTVNNYTLE